MSVALVERIQAASAFVAASNGSDTHHDVSSRQKDKIVQLLGLEVVPTAAVPMLLSLVAETCFVDAHKHEINAALEASATSPERGHVTNHVHSHQNFTSFPSFLTQSRWDRLRSGSEDCMALLVESLDELGCRSPCEQTVRHATAVLVLCTESPERIRCLNTAALKSLFLAMKRALKSGLNAKAVAPIKHLPATPEKMKALYATLYVNLFPEEAPTKCPFSPGDYEYVLSNIRCRGNGSRSVPVLPVHQPLGGLEHMANTMGLMM